MLRFRRTLVASCGLALVAAAAGVGSASAASAAPRAGAGQAPGVLPGFGHGNSHGIGHGVDPRALALARAGLPARDGWGSQGSGTTGGAAADAEHVFVVHDRNEMVAALGGEGTAALTDDTPKIIIVAGTIEGNVDAAGHPLTCDDYAAPGYSLQAFLKAYDPATWGRENDPSGPLEDARLASRNNQRDRVQIPVGSNTTIIGVHGATLHGANLLLGTSSHSVSNIIVRNLSFVDAADCFPEWSPTDGSAGNWNSLYDNLTMARATHVWLDHNSFSDGTNTDDKQPVYFGRPYQVHDGLSDIIRGSDLITVSYNRYSDHDKSILVGSTNNPPPADNPKSDINRLRVTFHHNAFVNLGQRAPRVRFGKVDVFDNYYVVTDAETFQYSWGVGKESALYAENNLFARCADVKLDAFIHDWGGTAMTEKGTWVSNRHGRAAPTSLLKAYNAANTPALGSDAGWTPTLRRHVDPTFAVPTLVTWFAGSGRLGI